MAVNNDLIQLLVSPGCLALRAQVVEDQQRDTLDVIDVIKEIVVSDGAARGVHPPQVIQQGRDKGMKGLAPLPEPLHLYAGSQVSLAAAPGAAEHHPVRRTVSRGKLARRLVGSNQSLALQRGLTCVDIGCRRRSVNNAPASLWRLS